jgi:hypothetical protein
MANNIFTNQLNNRELMNAFGIQQDNAPLTPEELVALSEQQQAPAVEEIVEPMVPTTVSSVVKAAPNMPKEELQQAPTATIVPKEDLTKPLVPETPMSKSEALMAEYRKMMGEDQQKLEEARRQDRMLKVGGALGDALATYINARGQMNVKAPGVQVQQGAGIGKIADMFATSGDIASDVAQRREALLKQYAELAKGERSQAKLESEEKKAKSSEALRRDLSKAENEAMLKAAGIRASKKDKEKPEFTPYQEKMLGEKQEEKVRKLSSDISKSGLPRLTTSIKELETQLGMTLEEALALNTDKDETNDVNIPGYGRLGSLAPDWAVGETQRAFRQGVQAVLNPDISKQYGATQSAGEIERYQKQIGGGNFEDQNAVLRGLAAIKTAAQSDLNAIQAGYDPKLVEKYQGRKGVSMDSSEKEVSQGPYGEFYEKDGKKYRWNPSVNKYQLSK